jgi:hypothetical protein
MKKIYLYVITAVALCLFSVSCEKDLPLVTTNQPTGDNYQNNPAQPISWVFKDASVSTCTRQIKFTATPTMLTLGLAYAGFTFTIKP